ncbi:MAG: transcription repressor NadR [Oscillospiraceae bacterium]|nr:transcription repressor NadR [Oscillospiraceae bacterium]
MNTSLRRAEILTILRRASAPVAAKELASHFHVSRQVIVQDLAVIRASTAGIISTNRGYIIQQESSFTREFKVRHTEEMVEKELNLIVDYGGTVKNISVSHRVYGRITAEMDIRSRQDVQEYIQTIGESASDPLGTVTSGYHYHLVEASSEERLDRIEEKLRENGFLVALLPWELDENKSL